MDNHQANHIQALIDFRGEVDAAINRRCDREHKKLIANKQNGTECLALFIKEDSIHKDALVQANINGTLIVQFNGQHKRTTYDEQIEDSQIQKHIILIKPSRAVWEARNMSTQLNTTYEQWGDHIYVGSVTSVHMKPRTPTTAPIFTATLQYTAPIQPTPIPHIIDIAFRGNNKFKTLVSHGLIPKVTKEATKDKKLKDFAVQCIF
jgi:hypothetical protein